MEIARVKHTSVSTQFLEAVARCDYNRATELIGDGQDDFAKTLGAFLDVSVRQGPASAEAKLCTVGQLWDWSIGKCFRDLTLAHVMLAAGEVESAEHRLKMLEEALLSDPAQLGQWRSLIAQARSSFPARVAPPETGDCAPA